MKPARLAIRDSIRLFEVSGQTVAIVTGSKTPECHGPRLEKTRHGFDLACGCEFDCSNKAAKDKYFVVQPVTLPSGIDHIRVRHAGGTDIQRVNIIDPKGWSQGSAPILGYSQDFSLEEAFKDALKKLDPKGLKAPGLVEVVSLGALYGGFSGFSRMFVRVECRHDLNFAKQSKTG